jgi:choline dehydrogenase-like flavoprotein
MGAAPGFADRDVAHLAGDMEELRVPDGARPAARGNPPTAFSVKLFAEPTPNPSSVVRLDDTLDAFGQRRALLDWRLAERDSESARETLQVFAREIGAAGIGRVRILFPSAGFESLRTVYSHHHMGTTRMSVDSGQGVVDPDCLVHGIANLYVAGSSVFPTYGTANPTYTLLALAFRLADHLDAKLSGIT